MQIVINHGMIDAARKLMTDGNGAFIHEPGSLSCAIDAVLQAKKFAEFMPANRVLRQKLREAEAELARRVKKQRDYKRKCEQARAAAAS